jgi:hypothetical protein
MIVVTVDSDHDDDAAVCQEYRQADLYPDLQREGATLVSFASTAARKDPVVQAIKEPGVSFVSASGHGLEDRFIGYDGDVLLAVGGYASADVKKKVVHLLACHAGTTLGPDLVAHGAAAFFGYDVAFLLPPSQVDLDLFLECDAEIDRALVAGETAEAAFDRAFDAYTRGIAQLMAAGKPYLAAALERCRDHLCAPSVDPKYGRKNAAL